MADKCEECINRMMTSTAASQHSVFLVEFSLFIALLTALLDKITGWAGAF